MRTGTSSGSVRAWAARSIIGCLVAGGSLSPAEAVTFSDQTVASGVDHLHWNGVQPPGVAFTTILWMSAGCAAGDYDNDGWPDLYVTRTALPNLLFHNNQDGTFTEVGAAAGVAFSDLSSGAGWGDADNDGDLDLYVCTYRTTGVNLLYINNGNGTFTEDAAARGVNLPNIWSPARRKFSSSTFGDYDLDGDLDLHVAEWAGDLLQARNSLFQNDGTGYFTDVTAASGVSAGPVHGFSPGFFDMDNDNWPDLLIAADFGTSCMFRNNGNGTFTDITGSASVGTDENGMGSAVGDYDNDGRLDWFVTSIYDPNSTCEIASCNWGDTGNRMFHNEGAGVFTDATDAAGVRDGRWGWGTSFFDFDNDGDLDLGMTNGIIFPFTNDENLFNTDPVRIWNNNGAGVMTEVAVAMGVTDTASGKGFLCFDYDNDGDVDLFIANCAGHPKLYRNEGGNANNWLKFSMRGRTTNHFGLGARVYVQALEAGPTQTREISVGSNYQSHNDLVSHVGLGIGVASVHMVRVVWPASGLEQEFLDMAANQTLVIEEVPKGDVDLSGAATVADVDIMVDLLLGGSPTGFMQAWAADVDNNGIIDGKDLGGFTACVVEGSCP